MSNMYSTLYNALITLGYPVQEQGTFDISKLPETYVTYFLVDSPNNSHADNAPTSQTTRFQLVMYTKKPAIKQNADNLFKSVMLTAGFLRVGGGDLPFSKDTGHYAYRCDYRIFRMEEQ